MNRKNSDSKKSMVPGLVVLAAVLVFNVIADAADDGMTAIIAAVSVAVVGLVVAITVVAVKKAASRGGTAERPVRPAAPARPGARIPLSAEREEAIHCAHLTGREKYMEQINSFLKNGLIDRAEYNALRERYSKLNIPDDYHG